MKRLDQITGLAMLALAAVLWLGTEGLATWQGPAPGPRFMPLLLAVLGSLLGIVLIVDTLRRTVPEPEIDWPDTAGRIRVAGIVLAIVGYVAVAPYLGFVLGAALFSLVMLVVVMRQPVMPSVVTAVVVGGLIHLVFVFWLAIALPRGVFGF